MHGPRRHFLSGLAAPAPQRAARVLAAGALLSALSCAPAARAAPPGTEGWDAAPDYAITRIVPPGAPDRWDYLTLLPETGQLLVSHGDRTTIVDADDGHPLGELGPLDGAHGQVALTRSSRAGSCGSTPPRSP